MALEGDLKDIGLANIVQVICLERRKGGLFLSHRGEEGQLFFDNGEIIHASVGGVTGEEAVFKLLTWDNGWFRMTERVSLPHKTVSMNWNHLLLDGMRRIDEESRKNQREADKSQAQLTQAENEHDQHLGNDLIFLVSRMEQVMVNLAEKRVRKKPTLALEGLADMVNQTLELVETVATDRLATVSLRNVLADVLQSHPQTRILHVTKERLSAQTAVNLFRSWSEEESDRKYFFRQVARGLVNALETLLQKLGEGYFGMEMRAEWRETYGVFLMELRRAIERIPF